MKDQVGVEVGIGVEVKGDETERRVFDSWFGLVENQECVIASLPKLFKVILIEPADFFESGI